ncbi:MAG: hypothetical protein AAB914_02045 [Patescibacteria group bacterium]
MADDLKDLLGKSKYMEPSEIAQIKKFAWDEFEEKVGVDIGKNSIIITVDSSGQATALRYKITKLESIVKTDKKLVIRLK